MDILGLLSFLAIFTFIFAGGDILKMTQKMLEDRGKVKLLKAQQDLEKQKYNQQKELETQRFNQLREVLTDSVLTGEPVSIEAIKPIAEALARQIDNSNTPKQLKE